MGRESPAIGGAAAPARGATRRVDSSAMARLAVGFREHAGWAVAVVLEDASPLPRVVDRLRLALCPGDLPREVHHAAAQLDPDSARALVTAVAEASADATRSAIEDLVARNGRNLGRAGVPISDSPVAASSTATRKAHTMMHAAEGQLHREGLAEGCARAGLRVHRFSRRGLTSLASDALGRTTAELSAAIDSMGKVLGPPWARDQKDAALCAWLALLIEP